MAALVALPAPAQREQPHNVDAEKSVLGAVFIKPTAFDELSATLQVDDFFLPAHREIFEAMLALDKRRQPIDVIAVADELKTRGMLSRLEGGESYLLALANTVPTAENVLHYARLVKEKATLRRLIAACAEVQSSAYGDFGDFDGFVSEVQGKVEKAVNAADGRRWISTVERALAIGGGVKPLSTGIGTIDGNTRGGLRPGVTVIAGPPGSFKTALLCQEALWFATAGINVTILAADEDPSGLLLRIGQGLGFRREDLEEGHVATVRAFADRLAALPTLSLLDGAEVTIEAATRDLIKRSKGKPTVLCVDSIQTVRALGSDDADGPRAKTDVIVHALKASARSGLIVVASCEVARAFYRSQNPAERADPLAAFKESGSIEYAAHLALVMSSVKGEVGVVDVEVAKNRWGSGKTPMRMTMNFATATLTETALPDGGRAGAGRPDPEVQADLDVSHAREVLRAHPGVGGMRALCDYLNGWGRARREQAARRLRESGQVREEPGSRNSVRWYLMEGGDTNLPNLPGVFPDPSRDSSRNEPSPIPSPYRGGRVGGKVRGGGGEPEAGHETRGRLDARAEGRL